MTERSAINTAIADAMAEIKSVSKGDTNAHGGYNFASIDGFLGGCRNACSKNGLHPSISVREYEQYAGTNNKMWATYTYEICMCHKSGEETKPVATVVALPITGAQTSGSAQSYALKQYLRGLFLMQTGEQDDPDFTDPPELELPFDWSAFDWKGWADEALATIKTCNRAQLHEWDKENTEIIKQAETTAPDIYNTVGIEYTKKLESFK